MKILNITAQKPDSTGSGVYLSELVKGFDALGAKQTVIAGICKEDEERIAFPEGTLFSPVYYKSESLPFPVAGMSDEMPYESTRYKEMTEEMAEQFKTAFLKIITETVDTFCPDLILCHHLYFLTAIVREAFPEKRVAAVCHGSDIRQIKKNPLRRDYIKEQIGRLDSIFALHNSQKQEIVRQYQADPEQVAVIGSGYNREIFYAAKEREKRNEIRIVFAGKLSEKKGVPSLIRSLSNLTYERSECSLILAGGYGNEEEYREIQALAGQSPYPVIYKGKLSQEELADVFRSSDVFVLPSFYEGLPLVVIEALACGLNVVCTDLPGIKEWMDERLADHGIRFVEPPSFCNTDDPVPEELPGFEKRLAEAIKKSIEDPKCLCDTGKISWGSICENILEYCR